MKKYLPCFLILLIFFTLIIPTEAADLFTREDEHNNLRLGNDYIVIVVNQDENAGGRFAIETTGGDPFRPDDDNMPLVYGRPKPWTSYTTIRIDGENYVFGGSTGRRAGESAAYGKVIQPPQVVDNTIRTTCEIDGLEVKQILTIIRSSTTGLYDTARIKYQIINNSSEPRNVGLRIMLDTMLGENDGAPFRTGEEAVTTDRMYLKGELPSFWQAFDSISSPRVTSQGTFKGPSVTEPDRVYFADWGSMADGSWQFDFNPGEEFIRKGEYEIDSAIALSWEPLILSPGEEKKFITSYGLGGITIVPGLISLGVTSPAEVTFTRDNRSFPVVAYVENTSEITAENVVIKLHLPDSFTAGEIQKSLGDMASADIAQVSWEVSPTGKEIPEKINYRVTVNADNTDANEVEREVSFVGPPQLEVAMGKVEQPAVSRGKLTPNPFSVRVNVKNTGSSTLYDTEAEISLPPGFSLAQREKEKKLLGYLENGEEVDVKWQIRALQIAGKLPLAVDVRGKDGYSDSLVEEINIPGVKPVVFLEEEKTGNYLTLHLNGINIEEIKNMNLTLEFDPEIVKPIYSSRGDVFVSNDRLLPWNGPRVGENIITITETLPQSVREGTVARLHFRILREGEPGFRLTNCSFRNEEGEIEVKVEN